MEGVPNQSELILGNIELQHCACASPVLMKRGFLRFSQSPLTRRKYQACIQ